MSKMTWTWVRGQVRLVTASCTVKSSAQTARFGMWIRGFLRVKVGQLQTAKGAQVSFAVPMRFSQTAVALP